MNFIFKKILDFIVNEWEVDSNGFRKRTLEYKSDLGGILGSKVCNTYEEQVVFLHTSTFILLNIYYSMINRKF